ncbi:MAG TPA: DUF427 domain-containing protein [Nevskia sp.]|nr:DUF427 domain-containing protein [Nevskia sp.]
MSKSPGHQKHPEHKVEEERVGERMRVEIGGEVVAESSDVILVKEDGNPPRYYFPREDVRMDQLELSATTSRCPYKGMAHYFSIRAGGQRLTDAAWSYEEPYDEHSALAGRLAFYDDKMPQIRIVTAAPPQQG